MKFILLGSGKIAEFFIRVFVEEAPTSLQMCGMVASDNVNVIFSEVNKVSDYLFIPISYEKKNEEEVLKLIEKTNPDFILSIQYPWILSQLILSSVAGRILNLHNAKLPEYRGHNTISHEILNCEKEHTTTLHWMDAEVDRGRVVLSENIPINSDDTAFSLWKRSVDASLGMLKVFQENFEKIVGEFDGKCVEMGGNYYSKNSINQLKEIPANSSPEEIDKISRAFWFPPHEPAYIKNGKRRLYILPNNYQYIHD